MISSEKTFRSLWCPHTRIMMVDVVNAQQGPAAFNVKGPVPEIGGARTTPLIMAISGNKAGAGVPPKAVRNGCATRCCSQWAWAESAFEYSQRTGEPFDPIIDPAKSNSDRLGYCGLSDPGKAHSRDDQIALVAAGKISNPAT